MATASHEQLHRLMTAVERAQRADPLGWPFGALDPRDLARLLRERDKQQTEAGARYGAFLTLET